MSTFLQRLNFRLTRREVLNIHHKDGLNRRLQLAYELARLNPNEFLGDYELVAFVYEALKKNQSSDSAVHIVHALCAGDPKAVLGNKNFMLTIRLMAVNAMTKESQKAAEILLEKLTAKQCLYSKNFMDMLECIASFDEDNTVRKMLDRLEENEPVISAESESFMKARQNNYESLEKIEEKIFDLTSEEINERLERQHSSVQLDTSSTPDIDDRYNDPKYSNLFASPVKNPN